MKAKPIRRILSVLLALVLLTALFPHSQLTATAADRTLNKVLRVGVNSFDEDFSPFYSSNTNNDEVLDLVNLNLLTMDRAGFVISNGIEGETVSFNGTDYSYTGPADLSVTYNEAEDVTVYTARLREDLKFWDGEPVTAKDLLFTYYTLLDRSYSGPYTVNNYEIVGLKNWQTQSTDELFEKYNGIVDQMLLDGEGQGYVPNENYTLEMYQDFYGWYNERWTGTVQGIYDYIMDFYLNEDYDDYARYYVGRTIEEIAANEDLKVAYAIAMWGFGIYDRDTGLFQDKWGFGFSWDLINSFPTIEDFVLITKAAYDGDAETFYNIETSGYDDGPIESYARDNFVEKYSKIEMNGEIVPSISGIRMLDDYTVEIQVRRFTASAVYSIFDIPITPMHYYGDPEKWDPANGLYGFECGCLNQELLGGIPRGAGPYIFESYENGIVTLRSNPCWYKGEPEIKTVQFKEFDSYDDMVSAINGGELEIANVNGFSDAIDAIRECNSNGTISGDMITSFPINTLGYGYIGLNAAAVNVGGNPGSNASKALRKALATVLAVCREDAVNSYYGDAAKVIEYPISDSSWAAPRPNDTGYTTAFSKDANGNKIYTESMSLDQRCAAAKAAALSWFQAAGYTVKNGKVTKAPNGAKLYYEVIIPGGGYGDHPSYQILTKARELLSSIGITLNISDVDANVLWSTLDDGTQELWCAAWGSGIDPDMYQVYHSSNVVGMGGTDSNHFHITDETLDWFIMAARSYEYGIDMNYRKTAYSQCLNIIMDWGVELPVYQRQNFSIYATQRVDLNTLTPEITCYWDWKNEIESLCLYNMHKWVETDRSEPSCTEDGFVSYQCTDCGETKTEVLPALGHAFERGVCTRCGYAAVAGSEVFDDVKPGKWYEAAVLWAVQNGITTGTGERTFSPNDTCTRAQVMTFLWHAEKDPNPSDTYNPFSDNKAGKWYYNAVLWAYYHDPQITTGTSETTFGINDGCTRSQVVTFLWKAAGAPEPETSENPFSDVREGKYYYKAVLWAYENGITSGVTEDSFGVHDTCTRAQIVTFLYKSYG